MNVTPIILAAGNNTRLHHDYPKCLYPLLRKPMISYLLDSLCPFFEQIVLVIKYKEELFRSFVDEYENKDNLKIAIQGDNHGTYSAVYSGFCESNSEYLIIIPGDKPLINHNLVANLISHHLKNNCDLTILSTFDKTNTDYLRIKKDNSFSLIHYRDLSIYEKMSLEIYTSVICINRNVLKEVFNQVPLSDGLSIKDIVNYVANHKYLVDTYFTDQYFLCLRITCGWRLINSICKMAYVL